MNLYVFKPGWKYGRGDVGVIARDANRAEKVARDGVFWYPDAQKELVLVFEMRAPDEHPERLVFNSVETV